MQAQMKFVVAVLAAAFLLSLCGCAQKAAEEVVAATNPSVIAADAVGQKLEETGRFYHNNRKEQDAIMDDIYPDPKKQNNTKTNNNVRRPTPPPRLSVTTGGGHHH